MKFLRSVGRRTRNNKIKTWKSVDSYYSDENGSFIQNEMIVNGNQHPICRGIMLAFFETIANKGYEKIIFLIEQKHYNFISKGFNLFKQIQNNIPYLTNTIKSVEFITNNDITNEN